MDKDIYGLISPQKPAQRDKLTQLLESGLFCTDICGGSCCNYLRLFAFTDEEVKRNAALKEGMDRVVREGEVVYQTRRNRDNGRVSGCPALRGALCSIYSSRPGVCSQFPAGNPFCVELLTVTNQLQRVEKEIRKRIG